MFLVSKLDLVFFFIVRSLFNPTLVNAAYYPLANWIGKYNISNNIISIISTYNVGSH